MKSEMLDMWECECGFVEYGGHPPRECSKCWKTDSFEEVPENMREEVDRDKILEKIKRKDLEEDDED